jgi:catechol 2,3-dioxygenase-like lactoylglutathione lyase family enzyme
VPVSLKRLDAITMFVEDLERAKLFYQRVFDGPLVFEDANSAVFRFENTIINLLRVPAAHDLIAPAVVASREAGSRIQLTIQVEDLDAVLAKLSALGIELLNGPMNRVWGVRTASFADPGGHIWEVAQPLPRAEGPA